MKTINVKIPKIKLTTALWIIFIVIVLLELFVLYQALRPRETDGQTTITDEGPVLINLPLYEEAINWLDEQNNFSLPESSPKNPFVEYR